MLGSNVLKWRTELKMTQGELAQRVKVGQTFIGQIERGEKQPSVDTLMKLSDALGVTTEELLRNGEHSAESAAQ